MKPKQEINVCTGCIFASVAVFCGHIATFAYADSASQVGAKVPFTTLQAEDAANKTNAQIVRLTPDKYKKTNLPELEAGGRGFVELNKTGDFVEFAKVPAFNGIVIRHCIPDAPEGGGTTATLGLYVNGERRQTITLSSKFNWLYHSDAKGGDVGKSDIPTAYPHSFWDEARYVITGGVKAGDTLRLQKDSQDTASFYRIDLIDVENIPAPLSRPQNSLSIADYGANGKNAAADTAAIQKCIDDAKAQNKMVWMPPGEYLQNASFVLDGVKVQGAGMWYTTLHDTIGNDAPTWSANCGFRMNGDGPSVSDLHIDSLVTTFRTRKGPKPFLGHAKNWRVNNVWIVHTNTGVWMGGVDGAVINCRIRSTFADGININTGAENILVENNHVRGNGDDGIAILDETRDKQITTHVTVRHNTVEAVRWGANCDLAGGKDHIIEGNIFSDGRSGFVINLPGSYPMKPLTSAMIQRNVLLRCGANHMGAQIRGAMWIYPGSTTAEGVVIQDNQILDSLFVGIHLTGSQPQNIVYRNNLIDHPGEYAIRIDATVKGSAIFENTTIKNLPAGNKPILNNAKDDFILKQQ